MIRYIAPAAFLFALIIVWLQQVPLDFAPSHEIQGFPLLEQPDGITCGPTSATMVLQYYRKQVDLDDVRKATKTDWFVYKGSRIGMTVPEYLASGLQQLGVSAKKRVGNLNNIKSLVSQDRPVIVLVRSDRTRWHYVVVIGYNDHEIIIADPGWGRRRVLPTNQFLGAWAFETDMDGTAMGKADLVQQLLHWTDVVGNTYIEVKDERS